LDNRTLDLFGMPSLITGGSTLSWDHTGDIGCLGSRLSDITSSRSYLGQPSDSEEEQQDQAGHGGEGEDQATQQHQVASIQLPQPGPFRSVSLPSLSSFMVPPGWMSAAYRKMRLPHEPGDLEDESGPLPPPPPGLLHSDEEELPPPPPDARERTRVRVLPLPPTRLSSTSLSGQGL
jgi:hypothetical protein